jgi:hypothetical protein
VLAALALCASSAASVAPDAPVAVLGSATISASAFDHWLVIANDANQASTGTLATPLPLPPTYAACIAALRTTSADGGDTAAQLKALCLARYRTLLNAAMSYLIQAIWVEGEANARGVSVTGAQVKAEFAAQRKTATPSLATAAELDAFMAKSGQTIVDLKWRTRLNLLARAIQAQVLRKASHVSAAQVAAYYAAHRSEFAGESLQAASARIRKLIVPVQEKRASGALQRDFGRIWRGRTVCRTGFKVVSCGTVSAQLAAKPSASFPGAIALPPSRPQTRVYKPS